MDDEKIAMHVANEFASAALAAQNAGWEAQTYWLMMRRPSMMLKPKLTKINNKWFALYHGVEGLGHSPDEAFLAFDKAWKEKVDA